MIWFFILILPIMVILECAGRSGKGGKRRR